MVDKLKFVGMSGSLRKGSYNSALLRELKKICPEPVELELLDLGKLPLFNQDSEENPGKEVIEFKARIKAADAVIFVTPEYNYSLPGVLKNAIDWMTRPPGNNSLDGKAVAIASASTGIFGGARAQYHFRQVMVSPNAFVLNRPEVMVPTAADKFDKELNLTDVKTREKLKELINALVIWSEKINRK